MTIRSKLVITFLLCGMLPLGIIGAATWYSTGKMAHETGTTYQSIASDTIDKIERNLFVRYRDVQAFGLNDVVKEKEQWYKSDEQANHIIHDMNKYVSTYGIYYLTLLVDLNGKVIAVNNKDAAGKPIDTAFLYDRNFASASWFTKARNNQFLKSGQLTGTVVEDVYVDELIKKIYKNHGMTMGFTAPVKDDDGKTIAIWKNYAMWSDVEEILKHTYEQMAKNGNGSAELTLLDRQGRIIVDCDPSINDGKIKHDMDKVLLKLNLAEKGVEAAKLAVKGTTGHAESLHARKQIMQVCGFAHSEGAMGYPGMGWSMLVRVASDEALARIHGIRLLLGYVFFGSFLLVCLVSIFVSAGITRPIHQMLVRLQDIAQGEGDLTKKVNEDGKDELSQLGHWFNVFLGNIRQIINQVRNASEEVASAAAEIASSADEMANGLSLQNQQTTQVSAAVEQMSATVNEVAQKSIAANQTSKQSGENATNGGQIVQRTVTSIRQIAQLVNDTATEVDNLGTRSEQIGQIIGVINDIADQTNLLALNAAIEAARAGEHGRGFAVVADEVRKLAERTTQATKEVSDSILAIQTQTHQAVERMNTGTQRVADGVGLAEEAGDALNLIVKGSDQVVTLIESIAAASSQQAQAAGDIARNVESINTVTRQTTEGATQSATAAAQLSGKAEELQKLIGCFKTA